MAVLSRLLTQARTIASLGVGNVVDVALYRVGLRTYLHPAQRVPTVPAPTGPFFGAPRGSFSEGLTAPRAWRDGWRYFGWRDVPGSGPPDWFRSPFSDTSVASTDQPWWAIPDFDRRVGDIKGVWEASRMDWVLAFAQQARAGDASAIRRLNAWLADWCTRNPPYRGPNWKCGQEASIRVMHLAIAARMLGQIRDAESSLRSLVRAHLRRIAPTMRYARAQDNNHGTSEAAGLFIGGSWLAGEESAARWMEIGREALEERATRLIARDGTFSQYSVTYHRVVLDTYSIVELWRRELDLPPFSNELRVRLSAAANWLGTLIDPTTGDAPNLGQNDGANLLPLTDADYRDFRPSTHLAAALFENVDAFPGAEHCRAHLKWLGAESGRAAAQMRGSALMDDGGLAVLREGSACAILRYPRYRFRPPHADALHVDLWAGGENLLRDGGTYSYADDVRGVPYFPGTAAHNTAQFDDREQMPRLGRFLWGDWLETEQVTPLERRDGGIAIRASYEDREKARHERELLLGPNAARVTDRLSGFRRRAVLRWRLKPGGWRVDGHSVSDGRHRIAIASTAPITRCELVIGWESRHYLQSTEIPVVEVELAAPGTVTTEYRWAT